MLWSPPACDGGRRLSGIQFFEVGKQSISQNSLAFQRPPVAHDQLLLPFETEEVARPDVLLDDVF